MRNIVKIFSILSIIAVIPGAMAATSRVSVTSKASPRLPSIAGRLITGTTTTKNTTISSTAAYYGDSECIEKYTDCIKEDDVCGSDFQECTTNVLFHGQMSKCVSVLYQCSSSGINALFGTTAINALSEVESYKEKERSTDPEEVAKYRYPRDGSVLGQLIIGAEITNKLTTEQCVRRYTNCLQRDDICGSDFELCTTDKAFKKQAMLCDSTLQRCQNDGKKELFGSVANAGILSPQGESRLKQLIDEGNSLAALNAVRTCQKVTDNCLVSACSKNPLRCVEGINMAMIDAADFITGGTELGGATSSTSTIAAGADGQNTYGTGNFFQGDNYLESQTGSNIRKMLKAQCLETIGSNKYCHMTYREKAPSNKELVDIDLQEDVFSLAYAARKDAVNTKVQEAMKKFDTKAKNNCLDTIKSCAMRSCGGGLGSVCYKQAGNGTTGVQVNGTNTYGDIMAGCAAIVNADANCIYAATSTEGDGYTYTYYDDAEDSSFNRLFPQYGDSARDPIGAVATLNALLATSYNDAAIEKMKKQCQTVALSCVKSMCGKDYVNCYRNRTDIVAGDDSAYKTDSAKFNRSMNKMGGVLDYNIVIGLCLSTVKNSSVCEEHLKVATASWRNSQDKDSWNGANSVRDAWRDANTTRTVAVSEENDVVIACRSNGNYLDSALGRVNLNVNTLDAIGGTNFDCSGTMEPVNGKCDDSIMDEDGCIYNVPVTMSESEYVLENGATTLFQTLLVDVEKEAQAIYNAKLTKEQHVCLSNNNGGIKGTGDNGSTFLWVKLKGSKIPKNYVSQGLQTKHFQASNDLYGSFCRARITVQSDDKDIQDLLKNNSVAYFAVGDSFTCGSWISDADLRKISDTVGQRELCKQGYGKWDSKTGTCDGTKLSTKEKIAYAWSTVGGALGGGALGVGLTGSGVLGNWVSKANTNNSTIETKKSRCLSYVDTAMRAADNALTATTDASKNSYLSSARLALSNAATVCKSLKGDANCPAGNVKDEAETIKSNAFAINTTCAGVIDEEIDKGRKAARIAVPIATTLAGGALGTGITASVIKQNRENIKNTAAQQWMDEIGDHIQCYIGTEELGTYGDVVSIELD